MIWEMTTKKYVNERMMVMVMNVDFMQALEKVLVGSGCLEGEGFSGGSG